MAKNEFHVVWGQKSAGMGLDGFFKSWSKTEAEEVFAPNEKSLKEAAVIKGPVFECKFIVCEIETAAEAAKLVRYGLDGFVPGIKEMYAFGGALPQYTGTTTVPKYPTVKGAEWKEETSF